MLNKKGKLELELLSKLFEKQQIFSQGDRHNFWDDEHISKNLLEAHLNRDWDAGSRKYETIKKTCRWLVEVLGLKKGMKLIDLGCGPGLYCSELYKYGLQITGVDYAKRSIEYAKKYAEDNKMDITYFYKNYLTLDYDNEFDVAILVYYDFACFSESDTKELLKIIYRLLNKGGYFVFDVQTPKIDNLEKIERRWNINKGGFWKPNNYLELYQSRYYPNYHIQLEQYVIIEEEGNISEFKLWERYYSLKDIKKLIKESGFSIEGLYSDLTGTPYNEDSKSIGLVVKK